MTNRRWDSLDAADEDFVEQMLRAGRDEALDDGRMRAIEGRLGRVLDRDAGPPAWWRRARPYAAVGLAIFALGVVRVARPSWSTSRSASPVESSTQSTRGAPAMALTGAPSGPSIAATDSVAVEALPEAEPLAPKAANVMHDARPRASSAGAAAPGAGGPNDELALLEEASGALDTSPQKTLTLTDEHAKRFRAPRFAQERERLAVVALVRLGRREEAKRRAAAFEAAYPDSAHLKRVRELVDP